MFSTTCKGFSSHVLHFALASDDRPNSSAVCISDHLPIVSAPADISHNVQDHAIHPDNEILVAVANMLSDYDPCQALAANFLTALLDGLPQASISDDADTLPDNWQMLAPPVAALPINGMLELVVISTDQKVSGLHVCYLARAYRKRAACMTCPWFSKLYKASHCIALHCIALHLISLHCISSADCCSQCCFCKQNRLHDSMRLFPLFPAL